MRIGINAALLQADREGQQTGISRYINELTHALRPYLRDGDVLETLGAAMPRIAARRGLRVAWEQTVLPVTSSRRKIDVLHGPLSVVPIMKQTPQVVTIHDLATLIVPRFSPVRRRAYMLTAIRMSARLADRVMTNTQRTADDLMTWLDVPASRIEVIPLAGASRVRRVTGTSLNVFQMCHQVDRPYILAVGTHDARKNLPHLLAAFSAVRDAIPHQLVFVGPEGWRNPELHAALDRWKLGDRVRLTGVVADEELGGWYSGADLFAFPSLYEGFGRATIEAMTCGAPVLTSDSSCFPEVVGDAGLMASPDSVDDWARAMRRVLTDAGLRDDLRERGLEHAMAFSWERTARETYDVYRSVVST